MCKKLRVCFEEMEDIGIVTHYKGKPFSGIGYHLYENGKLKDEIEMLNGLKDGLCKKFSPDGKLTCKAQFKDDMLNGMLKFYNEKSIVVFEGNCINDKKEGGWKKYDDEGVLEFNITYENDNETGRSLNPDLPPFYFAQKIIDEDESRRVRLPSLHEAFGDDEQKWKEVEGTEISEEEKYKFEKNASEFETIKEIIDFLKSGDDIKIRVEAYEDWDGFLQLTNDKKSDNIKHYNLYDEQGDQIIMITEKDGKQEVSGDYFVDYDGNEYDLKKQTYEDTVYLWQKGFVDKGFLIDKLNEFVDEDDDNLSAELYDFFDFLDMPQDVHEVMELFQVSDQTGQYEYSWHAESYIKDNGVDLIFCK